MNYSFNKLRIKIKVKELPDKYDRMLKNSIIQKNFKTKNDEDIHLIILKSNDNELYLCLLINIHLKFGQKTGVINIPL